MIGLWRCWCRQYARDLHASAAAVLFMGMIFFGQGQFDVRVGGARDDDVVAVSKGSSKAASSPPVQVR